VGRVLARAGFVRSLGRSSKTAYLASLMGPAERILFPRAYAFEIVPFCFDCWEPDFPRWRRILRRHRVRIAFFTAKTSADRMGDALPGVHCVWLPEAVDPDEYRAEVPLGDRQIDVLELGRRNEQIHDLAVPPLAGAGLRHRFEVRKGELIFDGKHALVEGLAQSKISVLYPSSVTSPARSGDVETVTHKYFESMASGCLVVGRSPGELIELFGYDPLIPLDESHPGDHLVELVRTIDTFRAQIERNYRRLLEVATWDVRAHALTTLLEARGYRRPGVDSSATANRRSET
jgi:hypothetical protein